MRVLPTARARVKAAGTGFIRGVFTGLDRECAYSAESDGCAGVEMQRRLPDLVLGTLHNPASGTSARNIGPGGGVRVSCG